MMDERLRFVSRLLPVCYANQLRPRRAYCGIGKWPSTSSTVFKVSMHRFLNKERADELAGTCWTVRKVLCNQ
jgi:hypothetical protein